MLFAALNIGSACNPIIAALENECGCTGSQESICGECVTPANAGDKCTDECGAHPCSVGLLCQSGQCSPFPPAVNHGVGTAARCEAASEQTSSTNSCGTGLYCRSKNCVFGSTFNDGFDHCSAYAQQGAPCGSTDSSGLACGQCEPGTQCVNGVCAAPCGGPGTGPGPGGDCARMCGGQIPICLALGSDSFGDVETTDNFGGNCYRTCGSGLGAACTAASPCCDLGNACRSGSCCETPDSYTSSGIQCKSNSDCCDPVPQNPNGQVCAPHPAANGGGMACQKCFETGAACTSVAECCGGSNIRCDRENTSVPVHCMTCLPAGSKSLDAGACCGGLTFQNGLCVENKNSACTVDADCPTVAPKCLCGLCENPGDFALGNACSLNMTTPNASQEKCLCASQTPANDTMPATCAPANNGAATRCCVEPLQQCPAGDNEACCTPPPCSCGKGGGSPIVCSPVTINNVRENLCCIPVGSGAANNTCNPNHDLCCPPAKCTAVQNNAGVVYDQCVGPVGAGGG